ncbi:MAG: hypothetical protein MJE66_06975 [Proteobacteria bacterium]|nr:hypothetical protein [Pseudomonadota bacterium]
MPSRTPPKWLAAPTRIGWALGAVLALALGVRLLAWGDVFVGERVLFVVGDAYYHLRLAEYSWHHFPAFLTHDPFLNFPVGGEVPWPPLYDLWVAGSALLLGGGVARLEWVAALWPPVLGALTAGIVFATARRLAGDAVGLGAAALFAVLPASLSVSQVGHADHHAAVAAIGAAWLWLQVRALEPDAARSLWVEVVGTALARAALVLVWAGSILYLGLADVGWALVAGATGRRHSLRAHAAGLVGTALLLCPFVAHAPGPAFTSVELSWLHPAACLALAAWAVMASFWGRGVSLGSSLVRTAALGAPPVAVLLALPWVREGVLGGTRFIGKADLWGHANPEQSPLYSSVGNTTWAVSTLGWLGYLLPLAPLALAWRIRRDGGPSGLAVVALWVAGFGALAVAHVRFVSDLAPAAAVGFAILLADAGRGAAHRLNLANRCWHPAIAVVLAVSALAPALWRNPGLQLWNATRHAFAGAASGEPRVANDVTASLVEFLHVVREVTPGSDGFAARPPVKPDYGILADPSLGHALHYVARRATPSDNFGPYLEPEMLVQTLEALVGLEPAAATAVVDQLQARYVLSSWQPRYWPGTLLERLQDGDGSGLGEYRLIAEGPEGGVPLAALFAAPPPGTVAYKLFERVPGAQLQVATAPGKRVVALQTVVAPSGRRIAYRQEAIADDQGRALLRVPYATGANGLMRAGRYRVLAGAEPQYATVSECQVLEGAVVVVPTPSTDGEIPGC